MVLGFVEKFAERFGEIKSKDWSHLYQMRVFWILLSKNWSDSYQMKLLTKRFTRIWWKERTRVEIAWYLLHYPEN